MIRFKVQSFICYDTEGSFSINNSEKPIIHSVGICFTQISLSFSGSVNTRVPKGSSKRVSSSTWCGVGLVVPQITSSLINTSESRDVHCPGPSWKIKRVRNREAEREDRRRQNKHL